MELTLRLSLPRDAAGVPVVRRLLRDSLNTLGVDQACVDDIELALSEACTNVLLHAGCDDRFAVSAAIDAHRCVLEIADGGPGFQAPPAPTGAALDAEGGRGLHLMNALLDKLDFQPAPAGGTIAHLHKNLTWQAGPAAPDPGPRP